MNPQNVAGTERGSQSVICSSRQARRACYAVKDTKKLRRTNLSTSLGVPIGYEAGELRRVCHVLIIEDEPLMAMDLEALLGREGAASFAFAATQDEAVREALARKPDLITSDVALIEGTGPLAVAIILDAIGPVPVIFITGTPHACEPCKPGCPILTKPFDRAAIARAFHHLVPRAKTPSF